MNNAVNFSTYSAEMSLIQFNQFRNAAPVQWHKILQDGHNNLRNKRLDTQLGYVKAGLVHLILTSNKEKIQDLDNIQKIAIAILEQDILPNTEVSKDVKKSRSEQTQKQVIEDLLRDVFAKNNIQCFGGTLKKQLAELKDASFSAQNTFSVFTKSVSVNNVQKTIILPESYVLDLNSSDSSFFDTSGSSIFFLAAAPTRSSREESQTNPATTEDNSASLHEVRQILASALSTPPVVKRKLMLPDVGPDYSSEEWITHRFSRQEQIPSSSLSLVEAEEAPTRIVSPVSVPSSPAPEEEEPSLPISNSVNRKKRTIEEDGGDEDRVGKRTRELDLTNTSEQAPGQIPLSEIQTLLDEHQWYGNNSANSRASIPVDRYKPGQ